MRRSTFGGFLILALVFVAFAPSAAHACSRCKFEPTGYVCAPSSFSCCEVLDVDTCEFSACVGGDCGFLLASAAVPSPSSCGPLDSLAQAIPSEASTDLELVPAFTVTKLSGRT